MSVYLQLRKWHVYYEVVITMFSYAFIFLVAYLALKKTSRNMQKYRLIILLSALVDFVFTTFTFLSMPLADMVEGKLFLMNSGLFVHVGQPYSIIIFSCWLFSLYLLLINVAMIFFYRYSLLCKKNPISMRNFALIYIAVSAYVSMQCVLCLFTAEDASMNFSQIISKNWLFGEDQPDLNVYDATKLIPFLHLLHGNLISTILYSSIVFTGHRVHKCLAFSRQFMSKNTISVQNQLTKIMVLQAVYPLFSLVFPILLYCSGPLFHATLPFVGIFLSCAVSIIPIVNSITTICVIPSFRRAILRAILGSHFNGKVSQTGSITIQGIAYNSPQNDPINPVPRTNSNEML